MSGRSGTAPQTIKGLGGPAPSKIESRVDDLAGRVRFIEDGYPTAIRRDLAELRRQLRQLAEQVTRLELQTPVHIPAYRGRLADLPPDYAHQPDLNERAMEGYLELRLRQRQLHEGQAAHRDWIEWLIALQVAAGVNAGQAPGADDAWPTVRGQARVYPFDGPDDAPVWVIILPSGGPAVPQTDQGDRRALAHRIYLKHVGYSRLVHGSEYGARFIREYPFERWLYTFTVEAGRVTKG